MARSLFPKLASLICTATAVLGARFGLVSGIQSGAFQKHLGYYWDLALLALAIAFFVQFSRRRWCRDGFRWRYHGGALLVIGILSVFLHVHEPHVMRVFYDEPSHVACSLGMHLDRIAVLPVNSNYVGDIFVLGADSASYRQYLYPLLISLLHDLTGYRVANAFVINILLTPVLLLAAYLIGSRTAGRVAGIVAVGLLGSLPLLAQNVCSAGYDVLTMALFGLLVLCSMEYAEAPETERPLLMNLSLAIALLLAVSRYEAILYLIPWALVTLALWWRDKKVRLTWFAAFSPLFLLPNLMAGLRMMNDTATLYTDMRPHGEAFFSVSYLSSHLPAAIYYFFGMGSGRTNSALLSFVGFGGMIGLAVAAMGAWRRGQLNGRFCVFGLYLAAAVAVYLFILTMFWSDPNDPNVARLALVLLFAGALAGGWLVAQFVWLRMRPWLPLGGIALWILLIAAPAMSRAVATYDLVPSRGGAWYEADAARRDRQRTLFIAASTTDLVARRYAAHNFKYLNAHPEVFVRALKAGIYREVVLYEDYQRMESGEWVAKKDCAAEDHIVKEPIATREFAAVYRAQICRLVGYRKADGSMITVDSDDPDVRVEQRFKDEHEMSRYRMSLYP